MKNNQEPIYKPGEKVHYHSLIGGPHDGKTYTIQTIGCYHKKYGMAVYSDEIEKKDLNQYLYWLKEKSGAVAENALSRIPF